MYNQAFQFAKEFVDPMNEKIDKEGIFPEDLFSKIGRAGYFELIIPKQYGGMGYGLRESLEVTSALSYFSPTVGLCYIMHNAALEALYENSNETLAKIVSEDIVERKVFMTGAHSEFETGVHCISKMNVENELETMTFTGRKNMITSANYAFYYLTTTPPTIEQEQDYWIFTKEMKGISFDSNEWNGIGMRGNVSAPMNFDEVEVDQLYRVGTQAFNSTVHFNIGLASVYAAICKRSCDISLDHVKSRTYSDGSALLDFDKVKSHISKLYGLYLASKSIIEEVLKSFEENNTSTMADVLTARIFASESSVESTTIGLKVGGGRAYNQESLIGQLHRDALASQVMTPSLDVLEKYVANLL